MMRMTNDETNGGRADDYEQGFRRPTINFQLSTQLLG
jgi:hypothetical protein